MPTYPNAKTDRRWRHRWQVVRLADGGVTVCCSHRWSWAAYVHACVRQVTNADTTRTAYDWRATPDLEGR